jgi:hypothetical protein
MGMERKRSPGHSPNPELIFFAMLSTKKIGRNDRAIRIMPLHIADRDKDRCQSFVGPHAARYRQWQRDHRI